MKTINNNPIDNQQLTGDYHKDIDMLVNYIKELEQKIEELNIQNTESFW